MLYAGATTERFPGQKYFSSLRFLEFAPRPPLPRAATLTRLAHQAPEGTAIALRAPSAAMAADFANPQNAQEREAALMWTLEAADRLSAAVVVFPTPAALTPGARGRKQLATLSGRLPRPAGRHYAWAPKGVWDEQESARLASDHGLLRAFDPLYEERPTGNVVYAQLRTLGHQTNFSDATLAGVLERIASQPFDAAFVSIASDRSFQQAQRLVALDAERDVE